MQLITIDCIDWRERKKATILIKIIKEKEK